MNPTFCKGCGKPLRWYRNADSGRWIPLDPDPDPQGTVRVDVVQNAARIVQVGSHKPLYRLHFDTCTRPWKTRG